jgi:aryl-alcohol dehydrogenase-like predicted oxidoreductase
MDYTTLGRTGLTVSVAGLGCGGSSCLGQTAGHSRSHSVGIIHKAVDMGVNYLDSSRNYGTEEIIGAALKTMSRDKIVIATKPEANPSDTPKTDYIDVYQLHSVLSGAYPHARDVLLPALEREREKGKIRFIGITEVPPKDHGHATMQLALKDDCWDVVMFAFHLLNHNARSLLFPLTQKQNVGTLIMFAVRSIFSVPGRLEQEMKTLVAKGLVPSYLAEENPALGFLFHEEGANNIVDAAYRYARHEPGVDVVLFGTGNPDHVAPNIQSILNPPLPEADRNRIRDLFGKLEGVGLDLPNRT